MKDLCGQTTLITGSASGIGRLMACKFADAGSILVLWDIQMELLEETKNIILSSNNDAIVHIYKCDLSKREEIYKVADQVKEQVGKVDILVNNAGIVSGRNFLSCPDNLIERTIAVNIMAHMWLAKKFLPPMIEENHGHIVTISSASCTTGVPGLADYCASKWAATGFDEAIRMELKRDGITGVKTTCICPYYINTGMFDGVKSKFFPILKPEWVVSQIMSAVKRDKAVLYLPRTVGYVYIFRGILPTSLWDWIAKILGISSSMNDFKGRGDNWALGKPTDTKQIKDK